MSHDTNMSPDEMTCRDVAEFLMAYVDGDLSTSTQQAFNEHLAQCSSCVRYLDHYRRTVAMAQAMGREITSVDAPPGVLRAIRDARMNAG
ncbi:MAG: anti-sigma factor family protein [Phycisphaerae bacterium]|jgi:anti-sigma factor RsiW